YDGVVVAPDARADQQLDRGRSDDWLHFWVWFSVARQLFADARARCSLGMARSLCCQRVTVCRRLAAAARAARDGRRTKSRCQPTAVASFAHRGLAADAADVRHRCNNERRVLLDLYLCRGAAKEFAGWRIEFPPGQYDQPHPGAVREAVWRLAVRSHRPA